MVKELSPSRIQFGNDGPPHIDVRFGEMKMKVCSQNFHTVTQSANSIRNSNELP